MTLKCIHTARQNSQTALFSDFFPICHWGVGGIPKGIQYTYIYIQTSNVQNRTNAYRRHKHYLRPYEYFSLKSMLRVTTMLKQPNTNTRACTCTCTCTCACTCPCTNTKTHAHSHAQTHTQTHAHANAHAALELQVHFCI